MLVLAIYVLGQGGLSHRPAPGRVKSAHLISLWSHPDDDLPDVLQEIELQYDRRSGRLLDPPGFMAAQPTGGSDGGEDASAEGPDVVGVRQRLWPVHCIEGTEAARLVADLALPPLCQGGSGSLTDAGLGQGQGTAVADRRGGEGGLGADLDLEKGTGSGGLCMELLEDALRSVDDGDSGDGAGGGGGSGGAAVGASMEAMGGAATQQQEQQREQQHEQQHERWRPGSGARWVLVRKATERHVDGYSAFFDNGHFRRTGGWVGAAS